MTAEPIGDAERHGGHPHNRIALSALESTETADDRRLTNQLERVLACSSLTPGDTVNITRLEQRCDIQIAHAAQ